MDRVELENRISKKEEQIKKLEKRVAKWEKVNDEFELRYAKRDLEDAQLTLKKYHNLLQMELAKENELKNNRVDVIWNFLLHYKDMVKEYVRENLKWLDKYYELNSQYCNLHNNQWKFINEGKSKEEIKEQLKELDRLAKQAKENVHPYTSLTAKKDYTTNKRYIDEEKLEEITMKDIEKRYIQLINQITKYTGKIKSADNLHFGNGELNGIVEGEEGKARVETISAGGYNIQCFHYRTLVHKIN
jgi:hypothetical protein